MMTDSWRELFDEARTENGKNNTARAEELVALAIQAAEHISPNTRSYSSAQCGFALWHHFHERYAEAEVFQQLYIDAEKRLGIGDRELGNLMMWLAEMQHKQGKLADTKTTIENAIVIYPDGCLPELSGAQQELSDVLKEIGDITLATQCRKTAIDLQREWDTIVAERQRKLNAKKST